jgi:flagellar protein FliS
MRSELATYQKNQVAGMSQRDLILLLYNGAIKFLEEARSELDNERTGAFADKVERVHRIIYHLYTSLDFDKGKEIAEKLGQLYSFVISQLYMLNSTRNVEIIDDISMILADLRDGWRGIGHSGETPVEEEMAEIVEDTGQEQAVSVQV